MPPRKSLQADASTALTASPAAKGRKSMEMPATPSSAKKPSDGAEQAPTSGLVVPPGAKAVFAQQSGAIKTLPVGLDQFELPKTSVVKLAKSEVPDSVQLRKEVATALVKASTVFISYLTAASHDTAISNGLKTISGQNVLDAVRDLDLGEDVRSELKRELEAFRTLTKEKRQSKVGSKKSADENSASAAAPIEMTEDDDDDPDASRFTAATVADQDEEDADQDQEEVIGEDNDEDEEVGTEPEEVDESVITVRSRADESRSAAVGDQSMEED